MAPFITQIARRLQSQRQRLGQSRPGRAARWIVVGPSGRGRRAAHARLQISPRLRVAVSLRGFRTDPCKRTKLQRQIVLPLGVLRFKEVAITLAWRQRRAKKPRLILPLRMRSLAGARSLGLAFVLAGVAGALYFGFHLNTHYRLEPAARASAVVSSPKKKLAAAPAPKTLPASTPTALNIPSVDISASVSPTGLSYDGTIAVPTTPDTTGWYQGSPTPGQLGPSVIVGHVDNLTGISVFWRLRYTQPGDEIDVARADGSVAKFRVDSVQQYSQDNFPAQTVYGNINSAGIRLITCGGTFSTATHHYSDNTVVFGSLI